jgi:hypothetical protein
MKYSCRLLIILLCFQLPCEAQTDSITKKERSVYNGVVNRRTLNYKTSVNFSPLTLANTDGQLIAGIEHRSGKGWAYAVDAGYIFSTYYLSNVKKVRGFELRPAIRYYHGKYKREYGQVQFFYKEVDYQFRDWLGKDVVNGTPSYERLQAFNFRKKVLSVSFMAGETIPLSNRIFLDVYGGIGARYKEQAITEANSVYEPVEQETPLIYGPKVWSICAPAGVKLSFILK